MAITVTELHQLDGTGDVVKDVEYPKATRFSIDPDTSGAWILKAIKPEKVVLSPGQVNYIEPVTEEVIAYYVKGSFTKITQS